MKIGALPSPERTKAAPANELSSQLDRMLAAGKSGDRTAFRAETQALAHSDAARAMQSQAAATVNRQEQAAVQQQAPAQPSLQPPPPQQQNPVISAPHMQR